MSGIAPTAWKRAPEGTPQTTGSTDPRPAPAPAPPPPTQSTSGVIAHGFGFYQSAASLTAQQAYRAITGSTEVLAQIGYIMPYPGSILALTYRANTVKTAGTASFVPFIAGTAQTALASWSVNNASGSATWPAGTYPFLAGDEVDVRITTDSSFAGTPSSAVLLYVTFQVS